MGGFKFSADLMALSVPLAFAATAFSTMVYRVVHVDPETTKGITPENAEAVKKGEVYHNGIRSMFNGRRMSIFDNEVKI